MEDDLYTVFQNCFNKIANKAPGKTYSVDVITILSKWLHSFCVGKIIEKVEKAFGKNAFPLRLKTFSKKRQNQHANNLTEYPTLQSIDCAFVIKIVMNSSVKK